MALKLKPPPEMEEPAEKLDAYWSGEGGEGTGESVKASLMTEVPEPLIPLVVLAGKCVSRATVM